MPSLPPEVNVDLARKIFEAGRNDSDASDNRLDKHVDVGTFRSQAAR
jgi:hypothetical protein